jgi:phage/plasmid-like protein (TIGR03299 family)
MAHELEFVNGQAQMAYRLSAGVPWHGLGVPVHDNMTPQEMMKEAGLDWTVRLEDAFIDLNGEKIATGQQALVRETDGRILTNVGGQWNPCQNAEAFDFFSEFVKAGDMVMDTAGSLKDGQIVFAAADVRDGFELFGGDEVKGYLLFSNPHMYGRSIDVKFVMTRVVCNNTLSMALTENGQPAVRMSHRTKFDADLVKHALGLSHQRVEQFKEAAEFLGSKRYNDAEFKRFLGKVFGTSVLDKKEELSRTANRAYELVETQPGAEFARGSWWSAYNVVTYMTDHEMGRGADTRAASAWFGTNAKRKLDALDLAVKMAEAA